MNIPSEFIFQFVDDKSPSVFVIPTKLTPPVEGVSQVALPKLSEVSTLPLPGLESGKYKLGTFTAKVSFEHVKICSFSESMMFKYGVFIFKG